MNAEATKTSSMMVPLVITAIIAIAGWVSYFFSQQEAAQYQKEAAQYQKQAEMKAAQSPVPQKEEQKSAPQTKPSAVPKKKPVVAKKEPEAPAPKYNKVLMAEREKALKEKEEAQTRISTALKEGEQLKQQLAKATANIEKLKKDMDELRNLEANKFAKLRQQLEKELEEKQVTISQLKNKMTIVDVKAEILFSSGSAVIKPDGMRVLDHIAETLNEHPKRMVSIEGHTDDVPVAADSGYPTNWELSSARASSAVRYLEGKGSVKASRLQAVGHGEHNPVASNETKEGRAKNRRIEIILLPPMN